MKTKISVLMLTAAALTGCVQTAYTKSIVVTKDADGRVVQTVETESVTQPGTGYEMRMEKIKGVQR